MISIYDVIYKNQLYLSHSLKLFIVSFVELDTHEDADNVIFYMILPKLSRDTKN